MEFSTITLQINAPDSWSDEQAEIVGESDAWQEFLRSVEILAKNRLSLVHPDLTLELDSD